MATKTKRETRVGVPDRRLGIVRDLLCAYATRGVLREFEERPSRGGKTEFRFTWLLDRRFGLLFDSGTSQLTLKDLLPAVPAKSALDLAVRDFVATRTSKELPAHRRVDPAKATLSVANRRSALSVTLNVKRNQYAYAVPRLLNFCNELFGFLDMYHIQYLWEHMGVPEE
jgi:hypothetical protein